MEDRKRILVQLESGSIYTSIPDLIKQLSELLEQVPVDCRNETHVETEYDDNYGSISSKLNIYYYRPETDQEQAIRLETEKAFKDRRIKQLSEELNRLQGK